VAFFHWQVRYSRTSSHSFDQSKSKDHKNIKIINNRNKNTENFPITKSNAPKPPIDLSNPLNTNITAACACQRERERERDGGRDRPPCFVTETETEIPANGVAVTFPNTEPLINCNCNCNHVV
jgi:hypothetical protein